MPQVKLVSISIGVVLTLVLITLMFTSVTPSSAGPLPADEGMAAASMDGKAIFLAQKCDTCHSVPTAGIEAKTKSEKMKGPDLVGVVQDKGGEWISKFLHKEVDLEGKKHPQTWKGTDAELKTLLSWLEAQKKPGS